MKKINIDLKKIKKADKKVITFWARNYDVFAIILFLLVALLGAYLIYDKVYSSGWTQVQKKEYLKTKRNEVKFKEGEFDKVVENIQEKNDRFNQSLESSQDVFK